MLHRLTMIGAISEVTGADASLIDNHYSEWITRMYPLCAAILRKRERDNKNTNG